VRKKAPSGFFIQSSKLDNSQQFDSMAETNRRVRRDSGESQHNLTDVSDWHSHDSDTVE